MVPSLATGDEPLFSTSDVVNVVIRIPMAVVTHVTGETRPVSGTLAIDDGAPVAVSCEPYGISRLRECQLPSLHLEIDGGGLPAPDLAGHDSLRLVTPCRLRGDHDRHAVLEHLVYATYAQVTDIALRTRLARLRFDDTGKADAQTTGYGFFIEDIDDVAARFDRNWQPTEPKTLSELDPEQLTLMTLFQFMIGNTDWSAVRAHGTERCCHNVAVLWGDATDTGLVVPFDFDQSGVVDPPYAAPAPGLEIQTVRQRVYRGFCEHNRFLEAAVDRFNRARPAIEAQFTRPDLPYPRDRRRALRYIDGFFEIINDPKKLERQIIRRCR